MNTYTKILFTTLPLVFFFLIATAGTTYYFSRSALLDLGETWLDTRLTMAVNIAKSQDNLLHEYGLETIAASIAKAKLDAISQIWKVQVGHQGYIFGVNQTGTIVFHPNKYRMNTDISQAPWFSKMTDTGGRLLIELEGETSLARFEFFPAWNWYILAVDPMAEVYGVSNRMRPYLYSLILGAAVIISLALMLLTRRLTRPLENLVQGAEDIGRGNLNTRISISANDEFGHLAREFNQMAFKLQETLTALKYSEEHFRALIENASDLIWIVDIKGEFLYISPSTQRILGYDPKELLGKNAFDYVHPKDRQDLFLRFGLRAKSIVKGQATAHRFRHKKEYWCTLESISKNLLDHPAISGMVINSRNITQRRRAEEALKQSHQELEIRVKERTYELRILNKAMNNEIQIRKEKELELERANQAKNNFLANVSHEIRTPLNSVIGFGDLLSTMITEKQQASYLSAITTAGRNLLTLINDILDLSKMEAGKLQISQVPVSLKLLFNEISHLFKVKVEEKDLNFTIDLPPDMPGVLLLDEMRLRQVITNVIDNAVKFTEKGSITLKAASDPTGSENMIDLEITIQDTGMGISRDKQEIIFESFQQESAGTSRKFGGTGLGLSICRQLTSLMEGHIFVSSTPGKGSLFTIHLPHVKISREAAAQQTRPQINLNKIQFSGQTVLVVDDHHDIRFMIKEILGNINLRVIEAANGQQAVETAREKQPDLILMDAKMPILSGIDAAARLKASSATKQIPICCMTASVQTSSKEDLGQDNFTSCLTKPIIIEELMEVLTRFMHIGPAAPPHARPLPTLPMLDTQNLDGLPQEVRKRLKSEILPTLPAIQNAMKISDIRNFAQSIQKLGLEMACQELKAFAEELFDQAETFNIEKIKISLKHFSDCIA